MQEGRVVTRYETVEDFLEAVKEIYDSNTRNAWVFVDSNIEIPDGDVKLAVWPVGGMRDAKWSLIREIKGKDINISFNIEEDPQLITFLGIQQ